MSHPKAIRASRCAIGTAIEIAPSREGALADAAFRHSAAFPSENGKNAGLHAGPTRAGRADARRQCNAS
jgi:hypothetical protein